MLEALRSKYDIGRKEGRRWGKRTRREEEGKREIRRSNERRKRMDSCCSEWERNLSRSSVFVTGS